MSRSRRSPRKPVPMSAAPTSGRVIRFAEIAAGKAQPDPTEPGAGQAGDSVSMPKAHYAALGTTGTSVMSGQFNEEYLSTLTGMDAAEEYDKMRRKESAVKMVLSAIKRPLISAAWEVMPGGDDAEALKDAEFIKHVLGDMSETPTQFRVEAASAVDFGYSLFEIVHKLVPNHPEWGTYIGLEVLGFRSQKTIERWNLEPKTCRIRSVDQRAEGDLKVKTEIPGDFLMVISIDREGSNYEGISVLRPCYGPYTRKDLFNKLLAIGVEKYSIPPPIGYFPAGKENSEEYAHFVEMLQSWTSHESNYITVPRDPAPDTRADVWDVKVEKIDFDPSRIQAVIDAQDRQMAKAVLAQFLELGQGGNGGSYSLSLDQSDFFLAGIEYIASLIAEAQNRVIRDLIKLNFGPRRAYPYMQASGVRDKAGKEFAEVIGILTEKKAVTADAVLEAFLRKRFGLPEASPETAREQDPPSGFGAPGKPGKPKPGEQDEDDEPMPPAAADDDEAEEEEDEPEERQRAAAREIRKRAQGVALAARGSDVAKLINSAAMGIDGMLRAELTVMGQALVDRVMSKYSGLPDGRKDDAILDVSAPGLAALRDRVQRELLGVSDLAVDQVAAEVPRSKAKLAKGPSPKRLRKVRRKAGLIAGSLAADLEKAVFFMFSGTVDSTASEDQIRQDLTDAAVKFVGGAAVGIAAANAASATVNDARNGFLFDDESREQIESYTFRNPDPQTEICQDLDGVTFTGRPEEMRYLPPLHHNCKSFVVPNLKGNPRNPEADADGLRPSSKRLERDITLHSRGCGSHQ